MATFSNWFDTIVFCMIIIIGLGVMTFGLNSMYPNSAGNGSDFTFGLSKYANTSALQNYQASFDSAQNSSTSTFTQSTGLTLSGLWGMIGILKDLVGGTIGGTFIYNLVAMAQLPVALAILLQILWLAGLTFIIIKLVTRVNP